MNARPFLFGDDFRQPAASARPGPDPDGLAQRLALDAAERDGFARGLAAGRREAEGETARRLADAAGQVSAGFAAALGTLDARADAIEADALAFFHALALKLAGQALAAQPLAAVAEAAREAFRHLRGVPHLAARVHVTLVDDIEALLRGIARESGYEGRLIVIADDEVGPGDVRLDWADGGVVRERRALDDAVAAVLARAAATSLPSTASTDA